MNAKDILQNVKLSDMKELLSSLRVYSDMRKKLGNRGKTLFNHNLHGTHEYVVEHFDALPKDVAYTQAQGVYKKSFGVSPKQDEIHFVKNSSIKGGMKVYFDDMVVDLSFKKIENLLQK